MDTSLMSFVITPWCAHWMTSIWLHFAFFSSGVNILCHQYSGSLRRCTATTVYMNIWVITSTGAINCPAPRILRLGHVPHGDQMQGSWLNSGPMLGTKCHERSPQTLQIKESTNNMFTSNFNHVIITQKMHTHYVRNLL